MANKSSEYPEGRLDGFNLKSFYAITGDDGDFTYTPGHERIPENWYTRNVLDQYTLPYIAADSNLMTVQNLQFASFGGNTGKTNSFVGISPDNLTSSVYSFDNLLEGNNLFCYGMQFALQMTPDILAGLYTTIKPATDMINKAFGDATGILGCPQLTEVDMKQFEQFPGFTQQYTGYKPPSKGLLGGLLG